MFFAATHKGKKAGMRGASSFAAAVAAIGALYGAEAFAPAPVASLRLRGASSATALPRGTHAPCVMQAPEASEARGDRRELLDRGAKTVFAAAFAPLAGALLHPSAAHGFSVPAGAVQGGKAGATMSDFLQGVVLQCENLDDEVAFWTQGLKMKVLRRTTGSVVVGFGAEALGQEKGGHFALELVRSPSAESNRAKVKLEMTLPSRTNLIIDAEEAGGSVMPSWFGTTQFVSLKSPNGFLVRIETSKQKEVAYPINAVAIQTDDVPKTAKEISEMLGMKPDDGFVLPFSDPKSKTLRFIDSSGTAQNVALVVEPLDAAPPPQVRVSFKASNM